MFCTAGSGFSRRMERHVSMVSNTSGMESSLAGALLGRMAFPTQKRSPSVVANVLEINPERLWESLERSAEIGRFREVGLRRLALSAEDKLMRDLFVDWANQAGCTVEIDRLGNIFARRAGSDPGLPPVAIGSHLDTQICG